MGVKITISIKSNERNCTDFTLGKAESENERTSSSNGFSRDQGFDLQVKTAIVKAVIVR